LVPVKSQLGSKYMWVQSVFHMVAMPYCLAICCDLHARAPDLSCQLPVPVGVRCLDAGPWCGQSGVSPLLGWSILLLKGGLFITLAAALFCML